MSILSLQNEFLARGSGRRFSIGWNARRTLRLTSERGLDEPFEKRMRLVRFALKLRVILAADKVGVIAQLDQFGEAAVGGCAGKDESFFGHVFSIFIVEFLTVTLP